ncbi:MAG: hypothetical protein WDZ90_02305 [Candidatus Paceibacterota bacterium]
MQFSFSEAHIEKTVVKDHIEKLRDYIRHVERVSETSGYETPESSINLAFDAKLLKEVKQCVEEKVSPNLKYVVVIGIGGSNLGTKAVYDAMRGAFDLVEPEYFPKLLFLDTNDPEYTKALLFFLEGVVRQPEELLIVSISKSGGTTETIANTEALLAVFSERPFDIRERTVVITDADSPYKKAAQARGMSTLSIPKMVGGRFSVFSAVGLFPLASAGFDIESLLKGAREERDRGLLSSDLNPALVSAIVLFEARRQKRTIHNTFLFEPECESLGKWYRQLMGESIGKEEDLDGDEIRAGITPIVSVGSTDLHSVGQLYLGGPRDKVTTFVSVKEKQTDVTIPKERMFPELVPIVAGKNYTEIMSAIYEGTKIAYEKNNLPYMEVILNDLSERSLGAFMQFKMMEMMYLAKLLNVNAFDQPNVESYKEETRKILEG